MSRIVTIKQKGDFKHSFKLLEKIRKFNVRSVLERYGKMGVEVLANATPKDTGKTAASWSYEILETGSGFTLSFINSNTIDGVNIAIILQYGHGTRNGGYVEGVDYINPAIQPIMEQLADDAWKEVTSV